MRNQAFVNEQKNKRSFGYSILLSHSHFASFIIFRLQFFILYFPSHLMLHPQIARRRSGEVKINSENA